MISRLKEKEEYTKRGKLIQKRTKRDKESFTAMFWILN